MGAGVLGELLDFLSGEHPSVLDGSVIHDLNITDRYHPFIIRLSRYPISVSTKVIVLRIVHVSRSIWLFALVLGVGGRLIEAGI